MNLIAKDPTSNLAVAPEDYPMPRFVLFRSPIAPPGSTHTGYVRCAHCERISHVTARVVNPSEDCPVKHFEGETAASDAHATVPTANTVRTAFDAVSPEPLPPPVGPGRAAA